MIQLRRIHHLANKIYRMDLMPFAPSALNVILHPRVPEGLIIRRFESSNVDDSQDKMKESMDAAQLEENRIIEKWNRWYRKKFAVYNVHETIRFMGRNLLIDDDLKESEKYYLWYRRKTFCAYWLWILEYSKAPEVTELKKRLKEANLSELDFSRSITKVFYACRNYRYMYLRGLICQPDDLIYVLRDKDILNVNGTQYESMRILFSLDERNGWKI